MYIYTHTHTHIYISKGNSFQESFEQFGGLALSSTFFFSLATCSNYSITSYVKIPVFHIFKKVIKVASRKRGNT